MFILKADTTKLTTKQTKKLRTIVKSRRLRKGRGQHEWSRDRVLLIAGQLCKGSVELLADSLVLLLLAEEFVFQPVDFLL